MRFFGHLPWRRPVERAVVREEKAAGGFLVLSGEAGRAHWSGRGYGALSREGFMRNPVAHRAARMVPTGFAGRFNAGGAIEITLPYGDLASASDLAVLNGANRIAIRCAGGAWEVAAFVKAEEVAANRWRLTRLLRGLAGTEDAMAAGAIAGAEVVVLDAGVVPMGLRADERGLQLNWIIEAAGARISSVGPFAFEGGMRAETPLAPVHLRGVRRAEGVRLTWVRRGRVEADGWDAADIPLDEVAERYRVEIVSGDVVRRTIEVSEAACHYAASDEVADFGSPQTTLAIRVRQLGRAVPLGIAASAVLSL